MKSLCGAGVVAGRCVFKAYVLDAAAVERNRLRPSEPVTVWVRSSPVWPVRYYRSYRNFCSF